MSFENIFKKVIQEISRELDHKNTHIKEVFIRYYTQYDYLSVCCISNDEEKSLPEITITEFAFRLIRMELEIERNCCLKQYGIKSVKFNMQKAFVSGKCSNIENMAGLLTMDPNWGISKNVLHNRHKIQGFVKYVTQKLVYQFDPDIITMKMQLFFSLNCQGNDEIVRRLRAQLNVKILPLQMNITRVTNLGAADSKTMQKFYKKLIYYMTLHSGMGNPTYENVFLEAQAALQSIITDQEMNEFIIRTKYDKKEKLLEYTELVAGIRLFNKHCGKGGEGIEDVPKMLRRAIDAVQQEIQKILLNVMQKVNVLTTILDIHFVPTEITTNNYEMVLINLPEGITLPDIERIKNLLVMFRQYEIFVRRLLSRVIQVEQRQEEISEKLWKMYDMINIVVQFKIAVPAHEVFPLFRDLAKTWYRIQDEALLLSKFNDVLVSLSIYAKQTVYPEYERQDWVTEQLLGGHQPQTDAERMRETTKTALIPSSDSAFQLKTPDNVENIHALNFEFLGFCPWKMVATNGALIPGNPNLGFVENKGKRYIFSNSLAMNIFNTDAKNYINRALELFRRKPDMIHFLGVENELLAVKDIEQLIPPELKRTETFSVECQTIDHPIPANIDPNYKWNVWDLKREALLLANLSHCKTSSTQTEECAGLSPAKTQTYDLKEQGVQTKRDHGTNVPKPLQYIFGLRGRVDDKQIQLDLTETVEHSC